MMPWFFRWKWMCTCRILAHFSETIWKQGIMLYCSTCQQKCQSQWHTSEKLWDSQRLTLTSLGTQAWQTRSHLLSPRFPRGGVFFPISEYWRLAYSPKTKNMGAGHDQGEEATYPPSLHHNLVSRPPTSYSTFLPRGFDYISFDLDPHWWS